jgi:hypothetical protein
MARGVNKRHIESRSTKKPKDTGLSAADARKYASIYATPDEIAQASLYQSTNVLRSRANKSGKAVPEKQGAPLLLSKYDPSRPEVQLPEGPLMPPRTLRPQGSFYSKKADNIALSKVGRPNKDKIDGRAYENRRENLNASKEEREQAHKTAQINASIYATPEEHASSRLYSISCTKRNRADLAGTPRPPLQGDAYDIPKYNELHGFVKPEGPLLPPRRTRVHGAFYSKAADDKAFEAVPIVSRGIETSRQFTQIPETGVGSEWMNNTQTSITPSNLTWTTNA